MILEKILKSAVENKASDIFFVVGLPITFKLHGKMTPIGDVKLSRADTENILHEIYHYANDRGFDTIYNTGDDDFSFSIPGVSRFRVSAYKQRGSLSAVVRIVNFDIPKPEDIGIADNVLDLTKKTKGILLITGPAGSGKSTTLACMIDLINNTRQSHIITLEDPLEYLHNHKKSIVSQREVSSDTDSYVKALRAALRQAPDVILLGEMRDFETINVAMTAAETGHLVISTLHTVGAANTIDRIIDVFPPNQQQQMRVQLSMMLQAVVSQQLVPTIDAGVTPAFEVMVANTAIRNMIRESKIHQIDTAIQSGASEGMVNMDTSLLNLYRKGIISDKNAMLYAANPEVLSKKMAL